MTTFTPCHRPAALFHVHERQSLLLERERVTVDGSAPDTDEEALHRDDIAATPEIPCIHGRRDGDRASRAEELVAHLGVRSRRGQDDHVVQHVHPRWADPWQLIRQWRSAHRLEHVGCLLYTSPSPRD